MPGQQLNLFRARPSDAHMLGTRSGHDMIEMWRVGGQMQRAERVVGCQSVSEPTKLAVSCAWQSLKAAPKLKDEGGSASKHGMSMRRTLHTFFVFQVWAEFQRAAPAGLQRVEVLCGFVTISGSSCPQLWNPS